MAASNTAPLPGAEIVPGNEGPALTGTWSDLRRSLAAAFPELQASFVVVYDGDVEQRLRQLRPDRLDAPDVLVGDALAQAYGQRPALRAYALMPVGVAPYELPAYRPARPGDVAMALVARRCQDPEAARAFAVWMRDGQRAQAERNDSEAGDAASVAVTLRQRPTCGPAGMALRRIRRRPNSMRRRRGNRRLGRSSTAAWARRGTTCGWMCLRRGAMRSWRCWGCGQLCHRPGCLACCIQWWWSGEVRKGDGGCCRSRAMYRRG